MSWNLLKWLKDRRKNSKRLWVGGEMTLQEPNSPTQNVSWGTANKSESIDKRIEAKPKDVVNEVLCNTDEVKVDFTNLKEKIKAVEKRRDFMKKDLQVSTSDEDQALGYLQARLILSKHKDAKTLFPWNITTQEKINELCKKYKVISASLTSYKRCVPQEALDVMEKYLKAYHLVSKGEPLIQLIVDVGGQEQKKDPIVYATSPFGNYYYVLGAWDKEIEILDELMLWK